MRIFDAHFHIIDYDFPITENEGYLPPSFDTTAYIQATNNLPILGGVIVSGSFQGFNQDYLLKALKDMGENYCGVTQLPISVSDDEIIRLNSLGVKALRFNVKRGGSENISKLEYFAKRVHDLVGWHSELYIDSRNIREISSIIEKLPAVSIDHLGLSEEGVPELLRLVDKGIRVKATGFGRVELNVESTLKKIHNINPKALMFGTDLPSTRAKRPFENKDVELINSLFDQEEVEEILYNNAFDWYFK